MKKMLLTAVAALAMGIFAAGCGESVNENMPLDQVKAEAAKLDKAQLEKKVEACKKFIFEKEAEASKLLEKAAASIKAMKAEETQKFKAEADKVGASIKKVAAQMEAYAAQLKK